MLAHRFEVPIVMQQCVAVLDTVCADDQVGKFTDCDPEAAQVAIVCAET